MQIEKWVSVQDVASHLGMSVSLVRKRTYDPIQPIPHHRLPGGRGVRFRISEIDTWIHKGEMSNAAPKQRRPQFTSTTRAQVDRDANKGKPL